jgi:hypothetical protein
VNCNRARKLLLQAERFDQAPAAVQEHLSTCARCRDWQRRLTRLERALSQVPVPRTSARVKFLCKFLTTPESAAGAGKGSTPRERIGALANLAENLHRETRTLAKAADNEALANLARLYEHVVRGDMIATARELPPEERRRLLDPIADRLAKARREADRLARVGAASASASLQLIAQAANHSDHELRALIQEPKSRRKS